MGWGALSARARARSAARSLRCAGRRGSAPLLVSLNWGEEMPTSSSTPATEPGRTPAPASTERMSLKRAWCIVKRASSAARSRPTLTASGSMSKACSRPSDPMAASMARECPPRPKVPSTNVPDGSGATSLATVSSQSAGRWRPAKLSRGGWPASSALLFAACT